MFWGTKLGLWTISSYVSSDLFVIFFPSAVSQFGEWYKLYTVTTQLMEQEAPPLALGHTDTIRQCEEIKNSEVNQCPLEDLRMVLEEGASVALRAHQKNCVARFRTNVEDGATALVKIEPLPRHRALLYIKSLLHACLCPFFCRKSPYDQSAYRTSSKYFHIALPT